MNHQHHHHDVTTNNSLVISKVVYRFTIFVIFIALFIPLTIFYYNCHDTENTRGILYDQKDCQLSIWWLSNNNKLIDKNNFKKNNNNNNKYKNNDKSYLTTNYKLLGDNGPFCRNNNNNNNYSSFNSNEWHIIDAAFDENNINIFIQHQHNHINPSTTKVECRFYNYRSQFISSTNALQVLPDIIVRCPLPMYIKQYEKDRLQLKLVFIGTTSSSSTNIFNTCPPVRQVKHKVEYNKKNKNSNTKENSNIFNISVCAQVTTPIIMNNEEGLQEWIEYHKILGVEHFFLYQETTIDKTNKILLHYQQKGLVTVIPWISSSDKDESSSSLVSCFLRFRATSTWILALPTTHDFIGLNTKKIMNLKSLTDSYYSNRADFVGFEFKKNIYTPCNSNNNSSNTTKLRYIHMNEYQSVDSSKKHQSYLVRTDKVIHVQNEKLFIKKGSGIDAKVTFVFSKMKDGKHIIDESLVKKEVDFGNRIDNSNSNSSSSSSSIFLDIYKDLVVKKIEEQTEDADHNKVSHDLFVLKDHLAEIMHIPSHPVTPCTKCSKNCVTKNRFKDEKMLSIVEDMMVQ